ncbi:MAG: hypothetical protein MZU95_10370 [Desulfomicrobium escambiense]|nr:hypothetical protein [Desulfomicrobium escambiense]
MSDRIPVDQAGLPGFRLEGRMMRYSIFMPRLYNLCRSLGFGPSTCYRRGRSARTRARAIR